MMEPFVQKQFDEYQANRTEKEIVSEKTSTKNHRRLIIMFLKWVWQNTLYQKYLEIQQRYPSQDSSDFIWRRNN